MDNGELYKQLYTLMEQNLFFGDRLDDRQFVSLLVPGQFVSTKLKKASADDQFNIFQLTDKTIDSTFLWKPLVSTVSGLYSEIVEFAALPDKEVDQNLIRQLASQLSKIQDRYDAYEQLYDDADSAWRKAKAQDPPDENLIIDLQKKRDKAMRNWEDQNKGQKKLYEDTRAELNYYLSGNPRAFWDTEVRQRMVDRRRESTMGSFFDTIVNPHPSDWALAGWESHTLHVRSVFDHEFSRSTSFSAGGGFGFGLWSFGGSYSRSTQATQKQTQVTDLTIQLEVLRVNISRLWMYQDLFGRRYWGWRKASHENLLISDGGNPPSERPLGPRGMPVLPTVFFVVRNVKLTGNWADEDRKFFAEQISSKASFGWGPFSASGTYSESTSDRTYTGQFADAAIIIEQPQIIAVGGILLPRSPNPDPGLAWSKKTSEEPWLTPASTPADIRMLAEARQAHLYDLVRQRLRREFLDAASKEFEQMDINNVLELASTAAYEQV